MATKKTTTTVKEERKEAVVAKKTSYEVKATCRFYDLEEHIDRNAGDRFTVTPERLAVLQEVGVVSVL